MMISFRSSIALALVASILSIVRGAFIPMQPSKLRNGKSMTQHLFGNGAKKTETKAEEKTKPFIFLYGRPQYDWVTGKMLDENSWVSKKRFKWGAGYTKSEKTTPDDVDTKKKGEK